MWGRFCVQKLAATKASCNKSHPPNYTHKKKNPDDLLCAFYLTNVVNDWQFLSYAGMLNIHEVFDYL